MYKVGDRVLLTDVFKPEQWSVYMKHWLGQIVKIKEIFYNDNHIGEWEHIRWIHIEEDNEEWTFTKNDIIRLATEEENKEADEKIKKEQEALAEQLKSFVYKPSDVVKIAAEIFGEERTDATEDSVIIHFPEVEITNGRVKHLMKDMYVRFVMSNLKSYTGKFLAVNMEGTRTTLLLKEYDSGYCHSHMSGGREGFSHFCLGSSVFATLLVEVQTHPIIESWEMVFMSLYNYLAWESTAGGPYRRISGVRENGNGRYNKMAEIDRFTEKIFPDLPRDIFELSSMGISLIEKHSSLIELLNNTSPVKILSKYSKKELKKLAEDRWISSFTHFKGKEIEKVIYCKDESDDDVISTEVINLYEQAIKQKIKKFNNKLLYEQGKTRREKRVFGTFGAFKQANSSGDRKAKKADRVSAQDGGK